MRLPDGTVLQLVATALALTATLVGACASPGSGTGTGGGQGGGGVTGGSGGISDSGGQLDASDGRTGAGGAAGNGGIGSGGQGGNGTGGMGASGGATAGHLQWSVPFATGTLEARATKGGVIVASDKVQTAGAATGLVLVVDRASIAADGRDLAFVEVDVVDAQGVIVPQASNMISFAVRGPGTLVGVDNGDSTSHESYKGTSRSAFSGKALAIIQSTTAPGTVTVTAMSGTLKMGAIDIVTAAP